MRRRRAEKRNVLPDRKYGNVLISRLINKIMIAGKKSIAEDICYTALENAAKKTSSEVLPFFEKVLDNSGPKRKVVARRFGGTTYSVPKEVKNEERPLKAISLIVQTFRDIAYSQGKKSANVLEEVLVQSYNNTGPAVSTKEKMHKTAEANAAFAHFQW
jgi:small subunit ribosomal protein S7